MDYAKIIETNMQDKLDSLLKTPNKSQQRAVLAILRRGAGKEIGELPDTYCEVFSDMPHTITGKEEIVAIAENAMYIALTLFGLHQQSFDPNKKSMHKKGQGWAIAAAKLCGEKYDESTIERINKRFNKIVLADSYEKLTVFLRNLVKLLRANEIPLDYVELSQDLFEYQFNYKYKNNEQIDLRLKWGRAFCRNLPREENENENK